MSDTVSVYSATSADGLNILYGQRYSGNMAVGQPIQLTPDSLNASSVETILLSNGGFVAVYNASDPNDMNDPYPFNYLYTREFSADGTLVATTDIGLNDYNASIHFDGVAVGGGAYAAVIRTISSYDLNQGPVSETQTLHYVDAAGGATDMILFQSTGIDGNGNLGFPPLLQTDAVLNALPSGGFNVSWSLYYGPATPGYPPPPDLPQGRQTYSETFDANGRAVNGTFIDFGHATDRYSSSVSAVLSPSLHNLVLDGTDPINGRGNALDNMIIGNSAKNHIVGSGGNDRIDGGLGSDYLEGDAGNDTFVFSTTISPKWNSDTIGDFVHGVDHMELSASVFSHLPKGQLLNSNFSDIASGRIFPNAHILYDASGNLFYDPDGAGSQHAIQFATLFGHPPLAASDILIV